MLEGGIGCYFVFGIIFGEWGYFYVVFVEDDEWIVGVVVVKFIVDGFE